MFKKLYLMFIARSRLYDDYVHALEKSTEYLTDSIKANDKIQELLQKLSAQQTAYRKFVPVDDFDFIDDEPQDEDAFKAYAGQVGIFYEDVLQRRLRDNIGKTRAQIGDVNQVLQIPRDHYDWYLRGMEAAFWSMNEWGIRMSAQRKIHLQDNENENAN